MGEEEEIQNLVVDMADSAEIRIGFPPSRSFSFFIGFCFSFSFLLSLFLSKRDNMAKAESGRRGKAGDDVRFSWYLTREREKKPCLVWSVDSPDFPRHRLDLHGSKFHSLVTSRRLACSTSGREEGRDSQDG